MLRLLKSNALPNFAFFFHHSRAPNVLFHVFLSHDSVTDSCPLILLYIVHSPIKYLAYTTKRMHHAQVTLTDAFF